MAEAYTNYGQQYNTPHKATGPITHCTYNNQQLTPLKTLTITQTHHTTNSISPDLRLPCTASSPLTLQPNEHHNSSTEFLHLSNPLCYDNQSSAPTTSIDGTSTPPNNYHYRPNKPTLMRITPSPLTPPAQLQHFHSLPNTVD